MNATEALNPVSVAVRRKQTLEEMIVVSVFAAPTPE
jgi:hypothetical protein